MVSLSVDFGIKKVICFQVRKADVVKLYTVRYTSKEYKT